MDTYYLFIDESGAKGTAKDEERFKIGLIAGYLNGEKNMENFSQYLNSKIPLIKTSLLKGDKLHIVSINNEVRQRVRSFVLQALKLSRCPCIYDAIKVSAFYASQIEKRNKLSFDKNELKKKGFYISNEGLEEKTIYEELFKSVLLKALFTLKENGIDKCRLKIVSDRLTQNQYDEMTRYVFETQNLGKRQKTFSGNGKYTGQIRKTVRTNIELPKEYFVSNEIKIEVDPNYKIYENELFVADVLSNTLHSELKDFEGILNEEGALQNNSELKSLPFLYGSPTDLLYPSI